MPMPDPKRTGQSWYGWMHAILHDMSVFSYDQCICIPNWNQRNLPKCRLWCIYINPSFLHISRVTSLFDCHGIGHPIYQPCTRFCHRLEASLQQVSPAISTDPIATIYICRFLFLILASKSDFNIFGYPA